MAEQIRSMQIDLSMRDLGVERTTGQVMRSFRDMKSEMLSSTRIFNRTEKSTKSYNNQLRNLRTTQASLKNELKAAERAEAKMADRHGENSTQALKASASVAKLKEEIDYMGKEIDQTSAEMRQFNLEQERLAKANATPFGRMSQRLKEMGPQLRSVGNSMRGVGQSMSMYVTAPVIAGFAGAVKASIDYEQALAGVAKTTDLSGKELQKMSNEITNMSNTLPFASTEIAGVAEAAGQLGVKKSEITDFTKTMLDMSVATNLTSEEAATEFARFANAAGMPISDVDRLGSAVVALGNSTATTEKEIVEMAQRLAGAGAQAGFNADEIMSISAAMSSVGIEAEAGGTAMTQIFNKMTKASAEGGEELNNFAKVSGMSATEFAQTWENNPTKALSAFVKGLGNTEGGAKGVLKALDSVGIKGIREADTIRRMSNNHGILNKALKTGEKGWKDNSALSKEAETRYKTLGSQLKVLRNNFVNFGRSLGDTFGPALGWIAEKLSGLFKYLQTANPVLKGFVAIFGLIAASIGPVLIGLGALIASIGAIVSSATAMSIIGGIFAAITSPITLIIAGIVALGAAFVIAYKKSETFRNIVNGAINGVVTAFKWLWSGVMTVLTPIGQAFMKFGQQIKQTIGDFWAKHGSQFMQAINNIKNGFLAFWTFISPVLGFIGGLFKSTFSDSIPVINFFKNLIMGSLVHAFNMVKNTVMIAFNAIKGIIMGVLNIVMGFVKMFIGIFTGDWKLFGEGLKQVARSFLSILKNLFQLAFAGILGVAKTIWGAIKNTIVGLAKGIWTGVKNAFTWLKNSIISIFNSVKTFSFNVWNWIKNKVVGFATSLWSGVKSRFNSLKNSITTIFNIVKNFLFKIWLSIKNKVVSLALSLYNGVRSRFNSLKKSTTSIFNSVRSFLYKLWSAVRNKVVSYAQSIWNGVKSRFNSLKNSIKSIFNSVRSFMYDIWTKIKNKVISLAKSLWNGVKDKFNSLKTGLSNIITKVKNNLVDTWESIKNKVIDIASGLWSKVKSTFNNMKDGLEGIIGDIKGHITGMVDAVKKGLNKLIDGVNWVGEKLGMDKLPKIKLHTGTESTHTKNLVTNGKINRDTFATVGDKGRGNGPGGFRHEMIKYPNGKTAITPNRDTTAFLPKGSSVMNGAQTHAALTSSPEFSNGTLPRFASGTAKKIWDGIGDGLSTAGHKTADTIKKGYSGAKAMGKVAADKIGDVMEYASNPGKLVDKVLSTFGVNMDAFNIPSGTLPFDMMKGMFGKLKKAVKDLFTGWLEESGGADLSSFDKYPITTPYSPNKAVPGYSFNGGRHYGIDYATPSGTTITAPTGGVVSKMSDNGGGLVAKLLSGKFTQFFLHLSDILKTGKVEQGEKFAKTGNSGNWTTGPHLHYQVEKGNSPFITNKNTIDPEKFASMGGGKNKKASAWAGDIRRAAKKMKVKLSDKELKGIIAQIDRESKGDAGVTQSSALKDINVLSGNPAQGLLQYVPATFKSYAMKGHGNIKSGYDQLLAFFNNKNWRSDLPYGKSGWGPSGGRRFATGGIINTNGMYNLAEDGHSEVVVPLDPARASDAMKLITYAQSKIKDNNKRPNQVSNKYGKQPSNDDNTNLLLQMIANQQKQLDALMEIARSNKHIEEQPKGFNTDDVSNAFGRKARMQGFNYGM